MTHIKSPFNFVPVSEKVFFPDWADNISHDIPFSDGISGTIHLAITACSPIFIRNGHNKTDAEQKTERFNSFSQVNSRFFIPATSIKGEVRNILEILSFSKIGIDNNSLFAQREWDNTELYPIKNVDTQKTIHCGWLKRNGDEYTIIDCGIPYRISHKCIDRYIGKNIMERNFSKQKGIDLTTEQEKFDPKTACYKYHLLNCVELKQLRFSIDNTSNNGGPQKKVCVDNQGTIKGTIVLTGQPDKWVYPRKSSGGKFYEFVFPEATDNTFSISEKVFEHYKFIYQDTPEWDRIKKEIETESGVPVFFRIEGKSVKDFGFAFLYKLPYTKTPCECLPEAHRSEKLDLSQCIFGYTPDSKRKNTSQAMSLKGRVHFGHAFSTDAQMDNDIKLVLNSPKASYYPIYIRQDGNNGIVKKYKTYNNGNLSGWKRYHVRKNIWSKQAENDTLNTTLHPVKTGATFQTDITFHNLRPIELGALLSALTFHNTPDCYHSLGQGKPYGFGKTKYSIRLSCSENDSCPEYYMAYFEQAMKKVIVNWLDSEEVISLLTIAQKEVGNDSKFQYMLMDTEAKNNEFVTAKKEGCYLPSPLQTLGATVSPTSLLGHITEQEKRELEKNIQTIHETCQKELEAIDTTDKLAAIEQIENKLKDLENKRKESEPEELAGLYTTLIHEWQDKKKALQTIFNEDTDSEKFKSGIETHLKTVTSVGNWEGYIKKWKGWCEKFDNERKQFTQDEQRHALYKLAQIFHNAKKADKKKFKWKEISKLIGTEIDENKIENFLN